MAINIKDENIEMNAVYITGAGFTKKKFSGYGRETMGWNETVWGGTLNRSNTFALENIDDVEIGQVPQLTIKYNYITIDDYIILQRLLKERHLIIEYFDIDLGKRVTHEMAITGNDRKQIITRGNKLIGMSNFTIKFVGTNRDEQEVVKTITYDVNGADVGDDFTETYNVGDQVIINDAQDIVYIGGHFSEWNTKPDGTGHSYYPTESITIWQNLYLYAIFR